MHRRWWTYAPCPACGPEIHELHCPTCSGTGFLVSPREDLDVAALRDEWREYARKWASYNGTALPGPLAERLRWAELP